PHPPPLHTFAYQAHYPPVPPPSCLTSLPSLLILCLNLSSLSPFTLPNTGKAVNVSPPVPTPPAHSPPACPPPPAASAEAPTVPCTFTTPGAAVAPTVCFLPLFCSALLSRYTLALADRGMGLVVVAGISAPFNTKSSATANDFLVAGAVLVAVELGGLPPAIVLVLPLPLP